jgi:tRNA dimethylallyltransferase
MASLLVIAGPTAAGKSQVALQVALQLGGEIVSADSVQVYRGLDIGTAKASPEDRALVPHHLLDIVDPHQNYTVADFQRDAREEIGRIVSRGRVPVLVGGTGLYIRALLRGYAFSEAGENKALRRKLYEEAQLHGPEVLHKRLAAIDPESASGIHPHDLRRQLRALEVFAQSRRPISGQKLNTAGTSGYDSLMFVLYRPREELYQRIEQRVEKMLAKGLVDEVKALLDGGVSAECKAMQSLGYRRIVDCLQGMMTLPAAVELIKRDTRRYAKRQLTWFRGEPEAVWIDLTKAGLDGAVENICAASGRSFQAERE